MLQRNPFSGNYIYIAWHFHQTVRLERTNAAFVQLSPSFKSRTRPGKMTQNGITQHKNSPTLEFTMTPKRTPKNKNKKTLNSQPISYSIATNQATIFLLFGQTTYRRFLHYYLLTRGTSSTSYLHWQNDYSPSALRISKILLMLSSPSSLSKLT